MTWSVRSPAFREGERIPVEHTCDGADRSPPLMWSDPPSGTRSVALIMDDPDAPGGSWVHWVLYNLPPESQELPAGVAQEPTLPTGAVQGLNDFRRVGYGGPCPPPGSSHRYVTTLYALDGRLELPPRATKARLEQAMAGRILGQARVMGRYRRAAR